MVRLVERLSNPVTKCIPQRMYIRLQAGADSGTIRTALENTVNSKRFSGSLLYSTFWGRTSVPERVIGGPQQKKMPYCWYDTLKLVISD